MTAEERDSLNLLINTAKTSTGGGRIAADLLLSWWNPADLGGFALTDLWGLDAAHTKAALLVIGYVARNSVYPDRMIEVNRADFEEIVAKHRPTFGADDSDRIPNLEAASKEAYMREFNTPLPGEVSVRYTDVRRAVVAWRARTDTDQYFIVADNRLGQDSLKILGFAKRPDATKF